MQKRLFLAVYRHFATLQGNDEKGRFCPSFWNFCPYYAHTKTKKAAEPCLTHNPAACHIRQRGKSPYSLYQIPSGIKVVNLAINSLILTNREPTGSIFPPFAFFILFPGTLVRIGLRAIAIEPKAINPLI